MSDTITWIYNLCGGCHAWGADPYFTVGDGTCRACGRTEPEITAAHGVCRLDATQRQVVREFLADECKRTSGQ